MSNRNVNKNSQNAKKNSHGKKVSIGTSKPKTSTKYDTEDEEIINIGEVACPVVRTLRFPYRIVGVLDSSVVDRIVPGFEVKEVKKPVATTVPYTKLSEAALMRNMIDHFNHKVTQYNIFLQDADARLAMTVFGANTKTGTAKVPYVLCYKNLDNAAATFDAKVTGQSNYSCIHDAVDCDCYQISKDVLLLYHCLGRTSPSQLLNAIRTFKVVYALAWIIDQPKGSLNRGEFTYVKSKIGVTFVNSRTGKQFVESGNEWLRSEDRIFIDGVPVEWDFVDSVMDTHLIRFYFSLNKNAPLPNVEELDYAFALSRADYNGPVNNRPLKALLTSDDKSVPPIWASATVPTVAYFNPKIYSFYSNLQIQFEDQDLELFVPKSVIGEVATRFAGQVRTPENFQQAIKESRKALAAVNITAEEAANLVVPVAVLGFTQTIEQENSLLGSMLTHKTHTMNLNNSLLSFNSAALNIHSPLILGLALLGTSVVAIVGVTTATYTLGSLFRSIKTMKTGSVKIQPGSVVSFLKGLWYSIKDSLNFKFLFPIVFTSACCKYMKRPEQQQGSNIRSPEVDECRDDQYGTALVGVGTRYQVPVVARSCTHNEVTAIAVRSNIAPKVDASLIKQTCSDLKKFVLDNRDKLFLPLKVEAASFSAWCSRFPKGKKARFERARTLSANDPKRCAIVKAFIKREHVYRLSDSGLVDFAPRLIQGREPQYTMLLGPWMWSYANELKLNWNFNRYICYASGLTAEELGYWFENSINELRELGEGVEVMEDDCSVWDGTLEEPMLQVERLNYKIAGAPKVVRECLKKQKHTFGICPTGTTFTVRAKRKSGDNNTSCGNSMLDGEVHLESITSTSGWDFPKVAQHVRMIVLGDDNLTLCTTTLKKAIESSVETRVRSYGLDPKIVWRKSLYQAEFCSGRFYPVDNSHFVWGPKLGRILSKSHYCHSQLPDRSSYLKWLRGVVLGNRFQHSGILIARTLNDRAWALVGAGAIIHPERKTFETKLMHTPDSRSYEMYADVYGLLPTEVTELEQVYARVPHLPHWIDHPLVKTIINVDCPIKIGPTNNHAHNKFPLLKPMSFFSTCRDLLMTWVEYMDLTHKLAACREWVDREVPKVVDTEKTKVLLSFGKLEKVLSFQCGDPVSMFFRLVRKLPIIGNSYFAHMPRYLDAWWYAICYRVTNLNFAQNVILMAWDVLNPITPIGLTTNVIGEELLCLKYPSVRPALIGFEAAVSILQGNLLGYIPALCMHLACQKLTSSGAIKTSIGLHLMFNMFIANHSHTTQIE